MLISGQPRASEDSISRALPFYCPPSRHGPLSLRKCTGAALAVPQCSRSQNLALRYLKFPKHPIPSADASPRIVLDSPGLRALDSADVDSMLRAFTTADLTHLRSLDLTDSALTDFLRANAATLQKIEIMTESARQLDTNLSVDQHDSEDADILLSAHRLTTLCIRAQNTSTMHATLRLFGNLGHLTALRDVKHEIFQNIHASDEPTWRTLDAAFSSVFDAALSSASDAAFSSAFDATGTSSPTAVLEVTATKYTPKPRRHFHFGTPLEPRETLSEWMPGLVERGALKVVSWEDEEEA